MLLITIWGATTISCPRFLFSHARSRHCIHDNRNLLMELSGGVEELKNDANAVFFSRSSLCGQTEQQQQQQPSSPGGGSNSGSSGGALTTPSPPHTPPSTTAASTAVTVSPATTHPASGAAAYAAGGAGACRDGRSRRGGPTWRDAPCCAALKANVSALLQAHADRTLSVVYASTALLNSTLDTDALLRGYMRVQAVPTSALHLLARLEERHATQARLAGVTVTSLVRPGVPEVVCLDSARVGSILNNLMSNAIKFAGSIGSNHSIGSSRRMGSDESGSSSSRDEDANGSPRSGPVGGWQRVGGGTAGDAAVVSSSTLPGSSSSELPCGGAVTVTVSAASALRSTAADAFIIANVIMDAEGGAATAAGVQQQRALAAGLLAFRHIASAPQHPSTRPPTSAAAPAAAADVGVASVAPAVQAAAVPPPPFIRFCVTDNGPGLAQRDLDTLFKEYRQTRVGHSFLNSSGLGLSIVRDTVELLGGSITVSSYTGPRPRTVFSVVLPHVVVASSHGRGGKEGVPAAAAAAAADATKLVVAPRVAAPSISLLQLPAAMGGELRASFLTKRSSSSSHGAGAAVLGGGSGSAHGSWADLSDQGSALCSAGSDEESGHLKQQQPSSGESSSSAAFHSSLSPANVDSIALSLPMPSTPELSSTPLPYSASNGSMSLLPGVASPVRLRSSGSGGCFPLDSPPRGLPTTLLTHSPSFSLYYPSSSIATAERHDSVSQQYHNSTGFYAAASSSFAGRHTTVGGMHPVHYPTPVTTAAAAAAAVGAACYNYGGCCSRRRRNYRCCFPLGGSCSRRRWGSDPSSPRLPSVRRLRAH